MMDRAVPMIGLVMQADSLEGIRDYPLPPQYAWRFFQPEDVALWAQIEISAGEFDARDAAVAGFRKYYPTDEGLAERMLFLTENGVPFATATAWFDEDGHGREEGRLHWVGIDEAHQGQRLSYPLVGLAMRRMAELGHRTAYLTTQTASWPAIKVYRAFGFRPLVKSQQEFEGWRIVSEKTGIDFIRESIGG